MSGMPNHIMREMVNVTSIMLGNITKTRYEQSHDRLGYKSKRDDTADDRSPSNSLQMRIERFFDLLERSPPRRTFRKDVSLAGIVLGLERFVEVE